jgi:hypothetical protein
VVTTGFRALRRCSGATSRKLGGKQIIIEDPSGNLVELFETILPETRLSRPAPSPGQPGQ